MSILIKGMNMPKCCDDCNFLYDNLECMATGDSMSMIHWKSDKMRLHNCPLIDTTVDAIEDLRLKLEESHN